MTGEKNRYKSLDKMWKLDDEQLKTPKHDEMVLYLLNIDIIKKLFENELIKNIKIRMKSIEEDIQLTEHRISVDNTYHRGFNLDKLKDKLQRLTEIKEDYISGKLFEDIKFDIISEAPIKAPNGFLIGYWDVKVELPFPYEDEVRGGDWRFIRAFYIEVKPKINSFGATLRQLRTYQTYIHPHEQVYLFTEDLRFKDAFESQGIKVISPPERQATFC